MKTNRSWFLVLFLALSLSACSGSDTVKIPDNTEVVPKVVPLPSWAQGEFPKEPMFYGHGEAPVDGDDAAATQAATVKAGENLVMELQILSNIVRIDHEEQVAELISKYPIEEMAKHVDAAEKAAVEAADVSETFTDSNKTPSRRHVLAKLPISTYFDSLYANPDLPDEQKNRLRDFQQRFTDNALSNLGRVAE